MLNKEFLYCDFDSDGTKEIFVFALENDSIFMYGINPLVQNRSWFYKKLVFEMEPSSLDDKPGIHFCDFPDINNDGFKEVVVAINAGFTLKPRNLFLIDIANNSVVMSPQSGTAILHPVAFDINDDVYNEYMGCSNAYGNWHEEVPYKDDKAWLMVVDKNMNFLFEPEGFGQYKTVLQSLPFKPEKETFIVSLQLHHGPENVENKLMKFNISGQKIHERALTNYENYTDTYLFSPDTKERHELYLVSKDGLVEKIDANLNVVNSFQISNIDFTKPELLDIDIDGKDELIFYKNDRDGIIITRNDFLFPVEVELANDSLNAITFAVIKQGTKNPQLYVRCGVHSYIFEYFKNPLYFLKYPLWVAVYGIVFTILYFLQIIQRKRIEKKYETEKEIARLQLLSLKNQIDPHFALNLISSIGALFYKKDAETAANIFSKYARMLRTTILSSEKISITLKKELEYIKDYLDLEKFRYDNKLDYEIVVENDEITRTGIPKMLIHTFVENAVKHGLKHLHGSGYIKIDVSFNDEDIIIKVTDNGVGRIKAREYEKSAGKESTGRGLKILDNILKLYANDRKIKIEYTVTDLYEADRAKGTEVVIIIPLLQNDDNTEQTEIHKFSEWSVKNETINK